MTDFAVTGKKGSGKGLFCVGLIRDAMLAGRPVATNMDIFPEQIVGPFNKVNIYRLPDVPHVSDLEAIGRGNEEIDDTKNGIIVLDETSKYFNARQWGDKTRQPVLDWLIHSRKMGWDVYYQMQGLEQVDKQLRATQIEYAVSIKRTDRWPIPFVTPIAKIFGINVRFPRMHIGVYRHGCERDALVVDRKIYRGAELYKGYDTRQVFIDREHPSACGLHTVLSAWHVKGRYLRKKPGYIARFFYGLIGYDWTNQPLLPLKPKLPQVQAILGKPYDEVMRLWREMNQSGVFDA